MQRQTLDISATACTYLNKSLLKFKAVAQSPDLPRSVHTIAPQTSDTAVLNVTARLCNSNPVKEALPAVLRDIQRALGVEVSEDTSKSKKRKRSEAKETAKPSKRASSVSDSEDEAIPARARTGKGESIGGSEDESDFAGFDARIAASSDEEDADPSGPSLGPPTDSEDDDDLDAYFDDDGSDHQPTKGATSRALARRAMSISPSPSPSLSPSPSPPPTTKKPTRSAFVPSLTMGGYVSGSGSDLEDDFDAAPKKNRRGQRARQAIAEKKFGSGAKHLQNSQAKNNAKGERDKGWDAKRGATDGPRRGSGRGGMGGGRGRGGGGGGARGGRDRDGGDGGRERVAEKKKHRDDEGPIHPSWAAAKAAKEAKAKATPAAFQGKKITFD